MITIRTLSILLIMLTSLSGCSQETLVLKNIEDWQKRNNTILSERLKLKVVEDQKDIKKQLVKSHFREDKISQATEVALSKYLDFLKANNDSLEKYPAIGEFINTELGTKATTKLFLNIYGEVTITSEPKEAQVFIGNEFVGYANMTYVVMKGNITITLKSEGYLPLVKTITVEPRRNYSFTWALTKTP